jgi:glycosyltransferase involved in cell wall biosynthesis
MESENQGVLVSVLMTAFNREQYIQDAIESVLASTYKNFELIIVDDCSIDRTVAIARKYETLDPRVKVFENKVNLGDYPNRNKAAGYASGKYLKYVDGDDLIYPWGLEILVNSMEKFDRAGWGLCSINQDEFHIYPFLLKKEDVFNYNFNFNNLFHRASLSSIIKREVFEELGGFSGKRHLGDFEMWLRLSLQYDVVLMPHGIVWHRIHDMQESVSNRSNEYVPLKYDISLFKFLSYRDLNVEVETWNREIRKLRVIIFKKLLKFFIFFKWNLIHKVIVEIKKDIETFS